jgi:hypothetical protein
MTPSPTPLAAELHVNKKLVPRKTKGINWPRDEQKPTFVSLLTRSPMRLINSPD